MNEHPEAIAEVKKAREFIERMTFKKEYLPSHELDDLFEKIMTNEKPAFQSRLYRKRKVFNAVNQWVKVAAILVFCVISAFILNSYLSIIQIEPVQVAVEWKTVENPRGIKSKVTLPDGTMVVLNSSSQIEYPVSFSDSIRLVKLEGEAFFEVERDVKKPFIIQSERMTTEVLGTSFNLRTSERYGNPAVAVVTGLVKVSNLLGESKLLRPNEMALIGENNAIKKTTFDLKEIAGWKDGIIIFKRASFSEIEQKLSMWYGVDFVLSEGFTMEGVYTGEFVHESLDNVLKGIAYSSGFKYKISDDKVFIHNK